MGDSTGYPGDGWTKRDSALWYAEQGYRVGPLHTPVWEHSTVTFDDEAPRPFSAYWRCSCQARENCRYIGKHPRTMNGLKDFSTSAEVVAGWWDIWPDANIGIATGRPFAFVVDEDVPGALTDLWPGEVNELAKRPGPTALPIQSTPNGRHLLFDAAPDDFGNSTGGRGRSLGPGIDTRGDGGYIVAAPSTMPSGVYRWRSDPRGPWPLLPEPMAEALRPGLYSGTVGSGNLLRGPGESLSPTEEERIARWVTGAVDGAVKDLAGTPRGTRNHALNEHAFRLGTIGAHGVLDEEYVRAELAIAWNEAWMHDADVRATGVAPQTWESFTKTFASGWSAGLAHPREPWPPAPAGSELSAGVGFAGPLVKLGEAAEQEEPPPFLPLKWNEFLARDMTKAEWVAGDLFEAGQQVALVGAGKAGKSLLAFELARAVARGLPYLGAPGRPPRRVGYLDHENSQRDIQQRALAFGFEAEDLAGVDYYSFPPLPPLDTRAGGRALVALVTATEREVLFLDTVSRMIEGGENDSDTWLNLYRYSLMPLKAAGVACVRLDHFGKDHERGARGSSAKTQDVDHVWTLTKGEGGSLTLTRTHSRTGLGRDEYRLIRHGEQTEDGWAPGQTRHVVSDVAFRPAEWLWRVEASKRLDAAGVPLEAGYDRCRTELARIGIQASTAKVKDLVKWRKSGGAEI